MASRLVQTHCATCCEQKQHVRGACSMQRSLDRPAAAGWPFCKTACRPLVAVHSSRLVVVPAAASRRSDVSSSGGSGSGGSTAGQSADAAACGGGSRRRHRSASGSVAGLSQDELDRVIHEVIEEEMHSALEQELETLNQAVHTAFEQEISMAKETVQEAVESAVETALAESSVYNLTANLNTFMAITGVIAYWRGIWGLLDWLLEDSFEGYVACLIFGLGVGWAIRYFKLPVIEGVSLL